MTQYWVRAFSFLMFAAVARGQDTAQSARRTLPMSRPDTLRGLYVNRWAVLGSKMWDLVRVARTTEVNALVTPTDKSLAGDYMATIRAASRGETASTQFRVTVATSTTWGMVGFGIIAVALLLMFGAVARFGRR